MKKICLLATLVSVFALNANAADWHKGNMVRPYIGADYVYSHAKQGSRVKHAKKEYSSWKVNLGMDIAKYTSIEAFFQQSGERKSHHTPEKIKSEYYAWGLDMYGKMPIMCSGFNFLGSLGLADYNIKYKFDHKGSLDKQRVGYRAGIGFSYDFTENVAMRVMGRYSYIGAKNLNHIMEMTAGLSYAF